MFFNNVMGNTCDVVPLSVSSLTSCQSGTCAAKQTGNWVLPVNIGSSVCLSAPPLGEGDDTLHFNLTVLTAFNEFDTEYCYFTDDYVWDIKGLCGCHGGSTAVCSNCPGTPLFNDTRLCVDGYHDGTGCFLHNTATWCLNVGFSGLNRYKICKIKPNPTTQIILEFSDGIDNFPFIYKNTDLEYQTTTNLNVTIYDSKSLGSYIPSYYLIDLYAPQNFYLLDSSIVNDINENNVHKIGWHKGNKTLPQSVLDSARVQVIDCSKNLFGLSTIWLNIEDYLINHIDKLSIRQAPRSFVIDPQLSPLSFDASDQPEHEFPDDIMLNGAAFLRNTVSNSLLLLGITMTGSVLPGPQNIAFTPTNITLSDGTYSSTAMLCSASATIYTFPNASTYSLQMCTLNSNPLLYGICVSAPVAPLSCVDPIFQALNWPNGDLVEYQFTRGKFIPIKTIKFNKIYGGEKLYLPVDQGRMYGNAEFLKYSIEFVETTVVPQIGVIKQEDDTVTIKARSTSTSGTCVMTFDPATVFSALTIELTMLYNEYRVPIIKNKFKGNAKVTVSCYKNKATDTFFVEINKKDDNDGDVTYVGESKDNWNGDNKDKDDDNKWYNDVSDWFVDAYKTVSGWFTFKWIRITIIVGLSLVGLMVVGKFIKTIYCWWKKRKGNGWLPRWNRPMSQVPKKNR